MMRPDEFSLHMSWSPRINSLRPDVPGFYVRASFANEGEAQGVVKESFTDGRGGNGTLVGRSFVQALADLLEREGLLVPGLNGTSLGAHLADGSEKAQQEALESKRRTLKSLKERVAQLEAELGA